MIFEIHRYVCYNTITVARMRGDRMKIANLVLDNFRGIEHMELELDGKSTIFFGINGVGKTSILRSLDLLYASIIGKLLKSRKRLAKMEKEDIMTGRAKATIEAQFYFEDMEHPISYDRSISHLDGRKHIAGGLDEIVGQFESLYITKPYEDEEGKVVIPQHRNMPVFVNYGVNRLVLNVPVEISKKNFTKLDAFDKAIESRIDFKALFEWFRYREDIENQEKVRNDMGYADRDLAAVKKAMLAMLRGFTNIWIEREPLSMMVEKDGDFLELEQLSDGEKCTIALFGDLARRLALANPERKNPLLGSGVVLIDEIELHMHTSWQRTIVGVLRATFPNIQFMITTHSPQVLGEVGEGFVFYGIAKEDSRVLVRPFKSLYGWDSNVILEEVMGTSCVNQAVKELEGKMYSALEKKEYDTTEALADQLDALTGNRNESTARVRVLAARGKRNEKNMET